MAVRFDEASDRITYSGSVPDPASGFTLLGWAYLSVALGNFSTFARLHVTPADSTTATFATDGTGLGGPGYFTGGGSVANSTGFVAGEWRKIAIACTGTTGKCYAATAEGVTEADSGTVGGAAGPNAITLGGRSVGNSGEWFNGRVAYWRMYSAELSQAEIEAEWQSTIPVRTADLFADWPLETAGDLTDHSGNGRDLSPGTTSATTEDGPPIGAGVNGTAAFTAPAAVAAFGGTVVASGELAAAAPAAIAALNAAAIVGGTVDGQAPAAVAAMVGTVPVGAELAAVAPAAAASVSGASTVAGILGAVAPAASFSASSGIEFNPAARPTLTIRPNKATLTIVPNQGTAVITELGES